jgi:hypothetical protein
VFPSDSAAIGFSFGIEIDWAVLQKAYRSDTKGERRYSPAVCTGIDIDVRRGDPNRTKITRASRTPTRARQRWPLASPITYGR